MGENEQKIKEEAQNEGAWSTPPSTNGCCLINHPGELSKVYSMPQQVAPAKPVHQVPQGQSGKDSQRRKEVDEEQPTSVDRSHGPLLLFLILISSQNNGGGDGDRSEFNSPRGEEARGSPSAAVDNNRQDVDRYVENYEWEVSHPG